MKTHCFFKKCRFNCNSKNDHKVLYARMKTYYTKKTKITHNLPSSKVNWEKYNEMFSN
jgi:hypothetical protein